MIDRTHTIPVARQCQLLKLDRATAYSQSRPVSNTALALMRRMGITAIYRTSRTSQRHPAHRIYPYLLRQLTITRPNHVWATNITYILMQPGFVYTLCDPGQGQSPGIGLAAGQHSELLYRIRSRPRAILRNGPAVS